MLTHHNIIHYILLQLFHLSAPPSLLATILLVSVSMSQFLFCLGCSFFNFFIFFLFRFLFFLFLFNYSCPHCPPLLSSALPTPISHIQSSHPPLSLLMGLLYMFLDLTLPLFSPITLFSRPLWVLSICSCVWFCFSHLFVLLIRFPS